MTAHSIHKMSDKTIKSKSKAGRYADGGGLYLNVKETGSKSWVFMWVLNRKRKLIGLGSYPDVCLALARSRATECRQILVDGLDPKEERDKEAIELAGMPTFEACAKQYIEIHEPTWSNPKHKQQWRMTLLSERYCPKILKLPVDQITRTHILAILQPIWLTKPETATRLRSRLERVFDYAEEEGFLDGKNPARMRGNLSASLPVIKKSERVKHHPAMPYKDVPAFVVRLQALEAMSARALEFMLLNATRPSETTNSEWCEFNLDEASWEIPKERMKKRKPHKIPLSDAAMNILNPLYEARISDYVFFGQKHKRPISNSAVFNLLKRMKIENVTQHGFRSSFRDWAGNETKFSWELLELSLAHTIGSSTVQAYRRSDAFEQRKPLMQSWAEYCTGATTGNVVKLHG